MTERRGGIVVGGGERDVWTFKGVTVGDASYLFLLVNESGINDELQTALDDGVGAFGEALRGDAAVVRPYKGRSPEALREVKEKAWDSRIEERILDANNPFLLVIDVSFDEFDPRQNRWALLWLEKFESAEIAKLFRRLAQKVGRDENVFDYLTAVARKRKLAGWTQLIEIKPKLFGVSLRASDLLAEKASSL